MPRKPAAEKPPQQDPPAQDDAVPEDQEPTPEAYEIARLALVNKLPPEDKRPTSIYGKLALITGLVGQVKKSGRNTFHNYTYARESDLVEAIRPLLSELGLWVHWTLHSDPEKGIIHHQRVSLSKKKDGDTYEAESLTVVSALFRFIDADGVESLPQLMMGYGDDNSDKGLYKALTGMEKYFLFKSFLVATGDDPEADTRTDQRAARREGGYAPRVDVRRGQGATPANGGRQAESSNPQIGQLGEWTRKAGMTSLADTITLYEKILDPVKVEPLDEDDLPGSLLTWIKAQPGPVLGKLIHDVRALAEAGSKAEKAGDSASPTVDAAAAAEGTTEKDVEVHSDGPADAAEPVAEVDPATIADDDVE